MHSIPNCTVASNIQPEFWRLRYNERTIRRFEIEETSDVPIIDCRKKMIKRRSNDWIVKLRQNNENEVILVSAMADATKVPPMGEFFQ